MSNDVLASPAAGRLALADRWARAWGATTLAGRSLWLAATSCSLWLGLTAGAAPSVRLTLAAAGVLAASAALIDAFEHRLPNALTASIAAIALAGATGAGGDAGRVMVATVAGGAVAGGAMLVVHLRRGVGLGDVKMAFALGLSAGSVAVVAAPVAIAVAALLAASIGVLTGRARLPLGPALWCGWAVSLATTGWGWWV